MFDLKYLREQVRNTGDFVSDANIKDNELNFWLQQAFNKIYLLIQSFQTDQFVKKITSSETPLIFDPEYKAHYIKIPSDFFKISKVFIDSGGYLQVAKRNEYADPFLRQNVPTYFYDSVSQNDRVLLRY